MADVPLTDKISENAQGPRKAAGDNISVEQHSLRDQIEADQYLEAKKATRKPGLGIKFVKLSPPGTA